MRSSLAALLIAALALVVPLSTAKASVLDQGDIAGMGGIGADGILAQTFTVGITGVLSSVELKMSSSNRSIDAMIGTTTAEGVPTNTILGHSTVNPGNVSEDWITFNFSPGISICAGEVLAIEVPMTGLDWNADLGDTYAGGEAYWLAFSEWSPYPGGPYDMNFQTFVNPAPEPSSLVLLAIGAAGLVLAARRRKA